ncbi:hypothetical protein GNI_030300 [Gregarina niphandrodes]|uniref:Uncharacterized protein n=1 Tax=Gregarina niphandrodes TaxID=110365 RepID=A0A023BB90_GRENI|nr:hypothetical protein GNI_030300 [Gregarina niphandrodes]EZG79009.1 hypothetical protein GNI_030300 [Gregarina niphandrodes]|eukprot:XP_011129145.1 hypothetical protein GNI_030300 [Gregarina niphandrodes]
MKLGFTGLFLSAWAVEEDCLKLPVRLWLHQDATNSYKNLVSDPQTYVQKLLDALNEKLDDFDFGGSLFRDRKCEDAGGCFNQGVTFGGSYTSKVSEFAEIMNGQTFGGGGDAPEDSLSAIPYIGKQHFDSLEGEQIRFFVIITDDRGKYHDQPLGDGQNFALESHTAKENPNPEESVNCEIDVWYPTIDQLKAAISKYKLVPITLAAGEPDWWRTLYSEQLGLSQTDGEFGVYPVENSVDSIAQAVLDSINAVSCIVVSTSTTAGPTPTTETTTTATTGTTGDTTGGTTGSTNGGTTGSTTGGTTGGTTDGTTATTDGTTGAEDHKKKNVVIAASAAAGGVAALAALGSAYRLRGGPPELDVEEEAAAGEEAEDGQRESIIAMEEEEYI